jgi:hypothetical protein
MTKTQQQSDFLFCGGNGKKLNNALLFQDIAGEARNNTQRARKHISFEKLTSTIYEDNMQGYFMKQKHATAEADKIFDI